MKTITKEELAQYIDYTKLKAETSQKEIEALLSEAIQHQVKAVCLSPCWVHLAAQKLKGTNVKVATVVGFPLGATTTEQKTFEAKTALGDGAYEIDMVINIGAIKSQKWDLVKADIKNVVQTVHSLGGIVKVILEVCLLTEEEKIKACQVCVEAKADFVKTSTGFSTGGATVHDIKLMKSIVQDKAQIKASGGVRTLEQVLAMIEAGSTRIGTSSIEFLKYYNSELQNQLGSESKKVGFHPPCCECKVQVTYVPCKCECHKLY